jgi:hypothetical protein
VIKPSSHPRAGFGNAAFDSGLGGSQVAEIKVLFRLPEACAIVAEGGNMFRFEKVTPVGIAVFPLFFCAAMLAGSAAKPVEVSGPLSLKEEFLGEKSPDTAAEDKKLEDTVSPSGERVAWRDKHGGKWQVMLNGKPQGPEFDDVQAGL